MDGLKKRIIDYVSEHNEVATADITSALGIKATTARQYLSRMSKYGEIVRLKRDNYSLINKNTFKYQPTKIVYSIFKYISKLLPFNNLCVYDGSIFNSLQHHVFINNAVYIETDRDSVDSVFQLLKARYKNTYRQPDETFMTDYVDLQRQCFIIKTLVTESPLMESDGIKVPSLEKLLVDIQIDADFYFLRGTESIYLFDNANSFYSINFQRLMRYAKRRGAKDIFDGMIKQLNEND